MPRYIDQTLIFHRFYPWSHLLSVLHIVLCFCCRAFPSTEGTGNGYQMAVFASETLKFCSSCTSSHQILLCLSATI